MTWTRYHGLPLLVSALLAVALGFGLTFNQQLSLVALVVIVGVAASAAPTSSWVAAALIAALTFRGLVELGLLPSVATLLDLPLAWGALVVAALKRRGDRGSATILLRWLAALGGAIIVAWLFHPSEVLRPLLYLALLGEPFAIVGAMCLDPPTPRARRMLERLVLALLLIQIPIAAFQFAHSRAERPGARHAVRRGRWSTCDLCGLCRWRDLDPQPKGRRLSTATLEARSGVRPLRHPLHRRCEASDLRRSSDSPRIKLARRIRTNLASRRPRHSLARRADHAAARSEHGRGVPREGPKRPGWKAGSCGLRLEQAEGRPSVDCLRIGPSGDGQPRSIHDHRFGTRRELADSRPRHSARNSRHRSPGGLPRSFRRRLLVQQRLVKRSRRLWGSRNDRARRLSRAIRFVDCPAQTHALT